VALKKDAVVKPVNGWKKRDMGRKPTAGRLGGPKELPRSDCRFGKKLTTAFSGMAQEKPLQENWDPEKSWTAE
jgi:hypothetical protein